MADLTADKRKQMPKKDFAGPGRSFPINDPNHARLAISGASRSYHAGNISKSEEERIQAEARNKLHGSGGGKMDGQQDYGAAQPIADEVMKPINAVRRFFGGGSDDSQQQQPNQNKVDPADVERANESFRKAAEHDQQPVDHKAAVSQMHPQHVHQLVQDAHAGKYGPDAQKAAQSAMGGAKPAPPANHGMQMKPKVGASNIFGRTAPQTNDHDADDETKGPAKARAIFGRR